MWYVYIPELEIDINTFSDDNENVLYFNTIPEKVVSIVFQSDGYCGRLDYLDEKVFFSVCGFPVFTCSFKDGKFGDDLKISDKYSDILGEQSKKNIFRFLSEFTNLAICLEKKVDSCSISIVENEFTPVDIEELGAFCLVVKLPDCLFTKPT